LRELLRNGPACPRYGSGLIKHGVARLAANVT
jgi:hypothetical protein